MLMMLMRVSVFADVSELNHYYQSPTVVDVPNFSDFGLGLTADGGGYDYSPPALQLQLPERNPTNAYYPAVQKSTNTYYHSIQNSHINYIPPFDNPPNNYGPPIPNKPMNTYIPPTSAPVYTAKSKPTPIFLINTQTTQTPVLPPTIYPKPSNTYIPSQYPEGIGSAPTYKYIPPASAFYPGPINTYIPSVERSLTTYLPPVSRGQRSGYLDADGYHY